MKPIDKILLRFLLGIVLTLAGLFLAAVIYFSVVYSPEYVRRSFFVGEATVHDYLKLPSRPLTASPKAFHFAVKLDEALVQTTFEANPKVGNLEDFLTKTGTQAFIVIRNDTILYEKYFNGAKRDSTVVSFSTAKSFTSALIGIAIQEGAIKSENDPITAYLPELTAREARFQKISIHDLLGMASGIRFDEKRFMWHDESNLTYRFTDLQSLALNKTVILEPPGKNFLYNDYNPILLGMILERATGKPVTEYLQEKLWTPLGMEFGGSWTVDSEFHPLRNDVLLHQRARDRLCQVWPVVSEQWKLGRQADRAGCLGGRIHPGGSGPKAGRDDVVWPLVVGKAGRE